jgi:hypothetical protein
MSIVRFDVTVLYIVHITCEHVDPHLSKAGIVLGIVTLIWYRPTCPGVNPAKLGVGAAIADARLINGGDGMALLVKSNRR